MNEVLQKFEDRAPDVSAVVPHGNANTPAAMIQLALSQGQDLDKLEKLLELQIRYEENEAKKAYHAAMAAFKANPPEIEKNKHVEYQTSKGKTEYKHASLDNVCKKINQSLSPHGLHATWPDGWHVDGGRVSGGCVDVRLRRAEAHWRCVNASSRTGPRGCDGADLGARFSRDGGDRERRSGLHRCPKLVAAHLYGRDLAQPHRGPPVRA